MMNWGSYYSNMAWFPTWGVPTLAILALVEVILKGVALWKSARYGQKYWFVAILVINSLGILPVVYLLWFSKKVKKS